MTNTFAVPLTAYDVAFQSITETLMTELTPKWETDFPIFINKLQKTHCFCLVNTTDERSSTTAFLKQNLKSLRIPSEVLGLKVQV